MNAAHMRRSNLTALTAFALSVAAVSADEFAGERRLMVEDIERIAASVARQTGFDKLDPRVAQALREVPRHEFVPSAQRGSAYRDRPLSIGQGQTISQPFIVGLMTQLLQIKDDDRVLEVGTGSGYQAAVLSRLAADVFSVEINPKLGKAARKVLDRLNYANVRTKIGDGYDGWKEHAPFDAIIVTAAPDHIPPALIEQLKPNGRMVIPVGGAGQDLMLVTKNADGTTTSTTVVPVRFVPLVRE